MPTGSAKNVLSNLIISFFDNSNIFNNNHLTIFLKMPKFLEIHILFNNRYNFQVSQSRVDLLVVEQ